METLQLPQVLKKLPCSTDSFQIITTTLDSWRPERVSTNKWMCRSTALFWGRNSCMLNSLDTTKANGPDGVSAHTLNLPPQALLQYLIVKLFNLSIRTGYFPQSWKRSSIVPIPKASKTPLSHKLPLNQLFAAKKGAGATMNGDPIHVSQCTGMVLALRPWPSFWVQVTKAVRVPKNEAINRNGFLKQRSIRQERMFSPWPPFRAEPGNDTDRSGL